MNSTSATAIVVEHKMDTNPVTINDVVVTLVPATVAAGSDTNAWLPKINKSEEVIVSEKRRTRFLAVVQFASASGIYKFLSIE